MRNSIFETVEKSGQILKLDFISIEFAKLAEEQDLAETQIQAVGRTYPKDPCRMEAMTYFLRHPGFKSLGGLLFNSILTPGGLFLALA